LDWFAEFNEDSGVCECIEGYEDSIDGCTPWANGDDAAGQAIMDEILRRLRFIGEILPDFLNFLFFKKTMDL